MTLRTKAYTLYNWFLILFLLSAAITYGLNFDDFKEDYEYCSLVFEDPINPYKELMYWKDKELCCHYTLNEDNNIIKQCGMDGNN